MSRKENTPKGGWLAPPPNTAEFKLVALETVVGAKKGGGFIWKKNVLTDKERKRHAKFQKAMRKADKKGSWAI